MNIADELKKLEEMHRAGALSDEEFARAKAGVLNGTPPPPAAPPFPYPPPAILNKEQETRQWAMFLHLSQFAGFVAPLAGLVLPIVLWQIKKTELPGIDVHGKIVVNWIISALIYMLVCFILVFAIVGIPLLIALGIVGIVFPVIGGIKANNGEVWEYPLSIKWFK